MRQHNDNNTVGRRPMKEHPNKHIQAALNYALVKGWYFVPGGKSSHCFGRIRCGLSTHRDHMMSIWSTPGNPENHAKQIIRMVERCSS